MVATLWLTTALVAVACSGGNPEAVASSEVPTTVPPTSATTAAVEPRGCTGELDQPETHPYVDPDETPDVDIDLVSVDVHRRVGASDCPVVVWIHGGGWTVGDKAGKAIDTKIEFAGELGAVLVSVNYRLATGDTGIRWPVMGEDAAAAIAWVVDNAAELGVDPERIALMGHSAGAHLAASLGTNPDLLDEHDMSRADLLCVVALDSAAYEVSENDIRSKGLFESAFGTDPAVLADASPTVQATEHPGRMPDFVVVTRGNRQRVDESRAFAAAVVAGGSSAEVIDAGDHTHEEVNTAVGEPTDEVVTPPVERFLESCLR